MKMRLSIVAAAWLTIVPAQAQSTNRWVTHPASLGMGPTALTTLLKYPDAQARAKQEMEVAFFCDIDKDGKASNFLLYRPNDPSNAFVVAVRKAVNASTFEPAISEAKPVNVQIGASVLFKIENGWPTPLVRLNISDKSASERDYTGPQLIGGQSALLLNVRYPAIALAQRTDGVVDLSFDIDIFGSPRSIRIVNESPAGHGFGESALAALRKARFIPALYRNNALKAPSRLRVEFNIEVIERYAPTRPPKKKN